MSSGFLYKICLSFSRTPVLRQPYFLSSSERKRWLKNLQKNLMIRDEKFTRTLTSPISYSNVGVPTRVTFTCKCMIL
ncbi:hypothetical protein LEP1GSC062_2738 [Leptospira alexanderi serovar Manhao 3 str. L 60]|uniref:Uncharacterized protein n=1 Tax=Leptospira alexanderi serovar Manhao 3 str. L 60 TaxID=1049759 RepID=V6I3P9_9LEPT|nr:hypothetical protein LEP1GSC062_2738 [Leptospira alexanderi serovar Manhao 3 str. L 60]